MLNHLAATAFAALLLTAGTVLAAPTECPEQFLRGQAPDLVNSKLAPKTESTRNRGAVQAAAANEAGWTSLAGMAGYQLVNRSWSVPSRVLVRVCRSRWAPFFDHCICCFLAKRRLMTRSTVASAKAVEMIAPWSQRSA